MAQASFEPGTFRSRVLRSAHCATLAGLAEMGVLYKAAYTSSDRLAPGKTRARILYMCVQTRAGREFFSTLVSVRVRLYVRVTGTAERGC